jgi:hypothetical protein
MKELLLTARPGKFLLTINARSCLVFKLTHFLLPFLLTVSALGFGGLPRSGG